MNLNHIPLYRWFMGSPERYARYLVHTQWLSDLNYDERLDFLMLVWHSEGCPDIE